MHTTAFPSDDCSACKCFKILMIPYQLVKEFRMLMRCATLCNRAEFVQHQSQVPIMSRMVRGDASEEAILKFIEMAQPLGSPKDFRDRNPKLVEVPFSSATKYQVIHARTLYIVCNFIFGSDQCSRFGGGRVLGCNEGSSGEDTREVRNDSDG